MDGNVYVVAALSNDPRARDRYLTERGTWHLRPEQAREFDEMTARAVASEEDARMGNLNVFRIVPVLARVAGFAQREAA